MFLGHLSAILLSLAIFHSAYGQTSLEFLPPLSSYTNILTGVSAPKKRCAGGQTVTNQACCAWFPVLEDILPNMFSNECGDDAHGALRLSFHDAIGFSRSKGEEARTANAGLDDPIETQIPFIQAHNVTPGDFIQFAAAVSLSLCPGAPRVGFMMGRPLPRAPAPGPDGLVPEPFDSVKVILARMADAGGFTPAEVVALLASHSIAGADDVDPTIPGTPFDSTPSLFDTQIFIEVQLKGTQFPGADPGQGEVESAVAGEMRLQSDHLIARDPATSCAWQSFAGNLPAIQSAFAKAFNKMSIIGHNPANLIDCSDVIPAAPPLPANAGPHLPAGQTQRNIQQACHLAPFPTFTAQPGPATTVPAIPQA
ncbi:Mn peroxidase MNP3 [Mycena leptocephala]|nr:Mn peroxidase MNP3 [Mycena leptocephala]